MPIYSPANLKIKIKYLYTAYILLDKENGNKENCKVQITI